MFEGFGPAHACAQGRPESSKCHHRYYLSTNDTIKKYVASLENITSYWWNLIIESFIYYFWYYHNGHLKIPDEIWVNYPNFADPATQDHRIPSYLVQLLSVSLKNDSICKYLHDFKI